MGKKHDIGADFAVSREMSGYASKDIAHFLETEPGRVSRIENGHASPRIRELYRLYRLYGLSLEELLPSIAEQEEDALRALLKTLPAAPTQWAHKQGARQASLTALHERLNGLPASNTTEYEQN